MGQYVQLSQQDGILQIVINRPQARNAVNHACAVELAEAFELLDATPQLCIGVLTGTGAAFSAGMDLKEFAQTGRRPTIANKGFAGLNEMPPAKPLIAAVEGFALAGGFEMVLACDLVVAARNAVLGVPETKRGLVPGSGGLVRLPRRLPYQVAMEMVLTGDPIGAERAHTLGLVNVLCEPGQALEQALALARRIADNGPLAVQAAKRIMVQGMDWSQQEMFAKQAPLIQPILASEDAREGALAFAQKRKPQWKGR
jgi:enoyl-CoA hydratase